MTIWLWIGFLVFILLMVGIDLGVLHRRAHVVRAREALVWTVVCVVFAHAFTVAVYYIYENDWLGVRQPALAVQSGWDAALKFYTGWIVEQSLSLDNIFVIALIFGYFRVPREYQHRVLFWGILGALVMRGVMIVAGAALIHRFEWMIYVFGGLLLLTAVKMLRANEDGVQPDKNPLVILARRLYPVTPDFRGEHFFAMLDGRHAITPLFLVLLVVESTDVLFAVDSIPAIFGITSDPFLVFTSNVFAILNLRSLYFLLAAMIEKFRYLKPSLVFILAFVGVKMILSHHHPIPTSVSLSIICGILFVGIIASLLSSPRERSQA